MRGSQILKRIFLAICILLGLNLVFVSNSLAALEVGNKAPAFKLPALDGGKEVALEDFLGKVVILHLWKCQ